MRARLLLGALAVAALLALPAAAGAHAYLTHTSPVASQVLGGAPAQVALSFDEAVEPRFAIVSVTDASGRQRTTAAVRRSPANPDTLVVPLQSGLPEGWYLVYWRAISVDGHPVSGAFTFAVGPNPGPAPQFPVPHVSATAVTPLLLITRWLSFLGVMSAIGLFTLRMLVARRVVRALPGAGLRALNWGFALTAAVGLIAIPVYVDAAVANDSLRSVFDLRALLPLFRATAFGRGWLDAELCFALFTFAAAAALSLDRPERERRSVAELAALAGAGLAAVATLAVPGATGHAAQTSPRGLSVAVDALHLASGSIWIGGLIGLLVLWFTLTEESRTGAPGRVAVLAHVVPRFSTVAFWSVMVLLATGTVATIDHMPAVDALWDTSYGVAILVKIGLLLIAMALAAGNLLRTKPRLLAAREAADGRSAAGLLRRLVSGEVAIVTGAVFTAAVLSSLAPPPPAFAEQNSALASVGPGRVARTVEHAGYQLQVLVSPNQAAAPDAFALRITRGGQPVNGATVTLAFNHTEMEMPQQLYSLRQTGPGIYSRSGVAALVMVGKWGLGFTVTPPGGAPFTALILDQADG